MYKKVNFKCFALALIMALCFTTASNVPARAATTVKVRPAIQYQTMDGWGTCLSWWATQVGGWTNTNRQAIMDLVFGSNGLGLNIARYNIGGGENPNCSRGANHMHEARKVDGFEPSPGVWDWTKDANQRWILKNSKNYGVNIFEAVSHTPPYWMTVSGCASGAVNGTDNNLKPDMYGEFADYLTEVVKYFRDNEGITFNTLAPINEPASGYWHAGGTQEGCQFNRDVQRTIIGEVSSKLAAKGLTTEIVASDETSMDQAIDTWNSFDAATRNKISRINTHSYSGSKRFDLRDLAKAENRKLWMSEFSTGYAADNHIGMDPALPLAETIMKDVRNMGANSWVIWQPVENEKENIYNLDNGQTWSTPGSWGLIHAVYSDFTGPTGTQYTKEQYFITRQYYVMKQFSKFIKQGYKIVETNDSNTLAAVNPANNELVLVVQNTTANSTGYTFDLSSFTGVGSSVVRYRTSNASNETCSQISSLSTSNKSFTDTLPAKSVTTYVISNMSFSVPSVSFDSNSYYMIKNRYSGKSLSIDGWKTTDGAVVLQWTDASNANSSWKLLSSGDGYFYIVNQNSNKALHVADWSRTDGAQIVQWTYGGSPNGKWKVVPTGDGYYVLENLNSAKAIHIDNWLTTDGAKAIQWSYNSGANGEWIIQKR